MDKKKIALASFSHFACDVNTGSLPAILPFLVTTHGLSYSALSGLMLANSSLSSFIQPLFGLLSDRCPKMWLMPVGILIAGFGMAAVGFLESYIPIFLAVALSGIGAALFHPAALRFTNSISGEKQGTGTSIFSIGGNIGFLLAPMLAVALIHLFGLQGLGILAVAAIGTALLLLYETRQLKITSEKILAAKPTEGVGELQNNWPAFARLTGTIVFRSVIMVCIRVFVPLYWIAYFGQTEAAAAFALTILGISGIIGNILGGALADKFGYNLIVKISCFAMVPLLFMLPYLNNLFIAYVVIAVLGFFIYASYSPIVVIGQKYLAKNIGFASGVTLGLSISLGGIFAPILGWIGDNYGLHVVFHTMGYCALLGFLFSIFLVPVARTR